MYVHIYIEAAFFFVCFDFTLNVALCMLSSIAYSFICICIYVQYILCILYVRATNTRAQHVLCVMCKPDFIR